MPGLRILLELQYHQGAYSTRCLEAMRMDRYFDYAASCPPFPEAVEVLSRVSTDVFGNPSSLHDAGQAARALLEETRRDIAGLCGLRSGHVVLTSGATEANNLVICGVMSRHPKGRILLAADVHASAWFARELFAGRTDLLPTGSDGRISLGRLSEVITPRTVLCSLLHVNNETGTVQDVAAIGRFCASKGVLVHFDGAQAAGHMPLDLDIAPFDFYTFSAHKFGGPRGVGGIFLKEADLTPGLRGGGQERGMRAGTENVAGFAAALTALERSCERLQSETSRLRDLTHILVDAIQRDIRDTIVNSDMDGCRPGIMSISFPGVTGTNVAAEMDLMGFALSSGSACHSGQVEPSRVILAMGRSRREALGTIRISMGRDTNEQQVRDLADALKEVIERQRALA